MNDATWTAPFYGVQHLTVKRPFQVSIEAYDHFATGYVLRVGTMLPMHDVAHAKFTGADAAQCARVWAEKQARALGILD